MEIKLYLHMIRRSWWIVVLTTLSAVLAALLSAYYATPVYSTSARYLVSPNANFVGGEVDYNLIYSLDTLDKRTIITTYAEVMNSPKLYAQTLDSLNLKADQVAGFSHTAVVLSETNIVDLTVSGPDPQLIMTLTNKIGENAAKYVESLYPVFDMSLLDPASLPTEPIYPQPFRDAGVALVVGVALGVALALVRELFRTPISNFMQQRKMDEMSQAMKGSVFQDTLKEVVLGSQEQFCICFLRLDGLRDYLDILPLPALQNCFRYTTHVLKNQLRGNDLVARWDTLEFAILLSNTRGQAAWNTMSRVQTALSVPIKIDITGEEMDLKPMIGISEYCKGDSAKDLTDHASQALDFARTSGGLYLYKATR